MEFLGDFLFFTEGASLKVMDVRLQQVTTHSVHTAAITDLCVYNDKLFTVGLDGLLVEWPERSVVDIQQSISACRVLDGTCYVVSEGRVHSVVLQTQELTYDALLMKFTVKKLAVTADQLLLLGNHQVCVYKPKTLERTLFTHEVRLNCFVMSPECLVAGDAAGQIIKYYHGGVKTKKHWHAHQVASLALSPDHSFMISGGEEGVAVLWQTSSSRKTFLPRLGAAIRHIAVSQSAEHYAFSLADNSVKVYRAADNTLASSFLGVTNPAAILPGSEVWTGLVKRDNAFVFNGPAGYLQTYDIAQRKVTTRFDAVKRNPISRSHCEHPFPLQVTQICFLNERAFVTIEQSHSPSMKLSHMKFWEDNALTTLVLNPHNNEPRRVLQFRNYVISIGEKFVMAWQRSGKLWHATHKLHFRNLNALEACASSSKLVVAFEHLLNVCDVDLKPIGEMCEPRGLSFKKVAASGDLIVTAAGDMLHCWRDCQLVWMQKIGNVVDLVAEDNCFAVLCWLGAGQEAEGNSDQPKISQSQGIAKFFGDEPVPTKVYPLDTPVLSFALLSSEVWVLRETCDIINLDSESPLVDEPFPEISQPTAPERALKPAQGTSVLRGTQSLAWLSEHFSYDLPTLNQVWEAFTEHELEHRIS